MASASIIMQDTANSSSARQITKPEQDQPSPPAASSPWARQLRQFGLFAAGAGFLAASVAVSRRAVLRRRLDAMPQFYSSNREGTRFDSADRSLMAAQALGLATLNVMSFGVMLVGGIGWAFDMSSLADLRARNRAVVRQQGAVTLEDEQQMEQMMSDLMGRLGMDPPQKGEAKGEAKPGSEAAGLERTTTTTSKGEATKGAS